MSLDSSITIGPRVTGLTCIDDQVFYAMVRKLCLSVDPDVVHMYMDNQELGDRVPDVYAQLVEMGLDQVPDSAMAGADTRGFSFSVYVAHRGFENGQLTNINRMGAAVAAIVLALEGRAVTHAGATEADGDHHLEVVRVGRGTIRTDEFTPAGMVQITATGTITRTTGNSMLAMPAQ